ncbi:DUF7882 family protein [Burkholderia cenocepacia]|uniref:DUF7882 family protein n=1 Tax=Burkholderia cenocepacia TaxID=95486 RepID=UPI0038CC0A47
MGSLVYEGSTSYEIEDRMLCHLRAVLAMKLRRKEGFLLSWVVDAEHGSGRVALWIDPAIPLELRFSGSRVPPLDPEWIEAMVEMAQGPHGLVLIDEHAALRAHREGRMRVRT